ncbi:SRPBCC family protein [Pseudonocardia endophytica]|uniref:Carbon monoxide dehydrogenase subunit G n=1 Tax=Pseudonocardia endophytica TaxID=401976 RepID=A0A4R1HES4_PSEEN|nr:SRPBCC family protein [Pseudonocardia endophytica]TCK20118.1 carbon monoxide dehydrogenase subunit G [Pseudonocardia endophytica]
MQLENKFTIAAPIEEAWKALNDPELIAPCFPGATLTEYESDSFTGTVKVKLGPISLTYKGKGTYVERDEANHKVVIDASGRDARGNGTAKATVTGTMVADGPDKTSVTMVTDMTVTGRPAQFGRGVISDVADKIIGQFSSCVADKLTGPGGAASNGSGPKHSADETSPIPAVPPAPGQQSSAPSGSSAPSSGPARVPAAASKPVEAIDLLDSAGAPVLKRLAPVLGGVGVLLLIFLIIRRARGDRS